MVLENFLKKLSPHNNLVWILNIGTELTLGSVVNTNGSWLAKKFTVLGYNIKRIIIVPDNFQDIKDEVLRAINNGIGIVLTTGGLGPTYDDSTASHIAGALGLRLLLNKKALEIVKERHGLWGEELTPAREKQAWLPEGSEPIYNPVGTAPGFILENKNTIVISLPGVPREMKVMFEKYIEPWLRENSKRHFIEKELIIKGVTESTIAPIIEKMAKKWKTAYIKSHPKITEEGESIIRIQIVISGDNAEKTQEDSKKILEELKEQLRGFGEIISADKERDTKNIF